MKYKTKDKFTYYNLNSNYMGYYINLWLKGSKIRCKKSTYSNYLYIVNSRISPKFYYVKKRNVTCEFIEDYTYELLSEGLVSKTVRDILSVLKQILKIAEIDISISMPKMTKNKIQIYTKEEQLKLENELLNPMDRTKFGIYFCLYTGLRIGEICALNCKNIDIKNKKVLINSTICRIKNFEGDTEGKTKIIITEPKTSSSIREIPIPNFIIPFVRKFCLGCDDNSFILSGNKKIIETRTYLNRYKKILEKIDLKTYNFHALRHTFATRCIENGSDAKTLSEILGHSNVKITLDRYVHPNYENKVKLMNNIKPITDFFN